MKETDLAYWTRRLAEEERRARIAETPAVRAFQDKFAKLYRQRLAEHPGQYSDQPMRSKQQHPPMT